MSFYLAFIDRLSNRRAVLVLLAGYLLVFGVILWTLGQLTALTGGIGILDFEQGYSGERVAAVFGSYGETGIRLVRRIALLDLVNPALYGLLAAILMRALYRPAPGWPVLLPLIAAFLDYAENVTIGMLLRSYPDLSGATVATSSALSLAKTSAMAAMVLALVVGAARWWRVRAR